MKQFLLAIATFWAIPASAQIIDSVDLSKNLKIHYIQVTVKLTEGVKQTIGVSVDYGQKVRNWKNTPVKSPDGEVQEFRSIAQMLNFFYDNGWKVTEAFQITETNNSYTYNYLFERK